MGRYRRVLLVSLTVAAAVVGGCGGGGGDEKPAPTSDTFITEADEICARSETDLQRQVTATFGNAAPTEAEGATFTTTKIVPMLSLQIESLRALTPPEGDGDTVDAIWDAMEETVEELKADPESGFGGTDPMAGALEQARAYGFKACGKTS